MKLLRSQLKSGILTDELRHKVEQVKAFKKAIKENRPAVKPKFEEEAVINEWVTKQTLLYLDPKTATFKRIPKPKRQSARSQWVQVLRNKLYTGEYGADLKDKVKQTTQYRYDKIRHKRANIHRPNFKEFMTINLWLAKRGIHSTPQKAHPRSIPGSTKRSAINLGDSPVPLHPLPSVEAPPVIDLLDLESVAPQPHHEPIDDIEVISSDEEEDLAILPVDAPVVIPPEVEHAPGPALHAPIIRRTERCSI